MATPATTYSPQNIGNAFVEQYYPLLHKTPEEVHKFYQDSSRIGRTGSDGVMEYVETLPEISKKIVSMDFGKYLIKIDTADAMLCLNGSVLLVVTGSFTSDSDDARQRFTQTFFLAPQEPGGYFVLSDILRFLSESNQESGSNEKDESVTLSVADTTPAMVEEPLTTDPVNSTAVENNLTVNGKTVENNDTVKSPVKVTKEDVKKTQVAASPSPVQKEIPKKHPVSASPPPPAQKDVPKKTYASIVKDNKEVSPPIKPKIVKPVSKPLTKVVAGSAKPLQAAETTPASTSATKSNTSQDEQGYSIFVRGLPSRSTVKMVGEEFKKFGAIKAGGIQVRNNKFDKFCFGFVEFETQQAMQAAIETSPILIAEKEVIIEKKRTNTRVVNGVVVNAGEGGRFQYARGAQTFRGQGAGYVNNYNQRNDDSNFNRRRDDGYRGSPHGNGYYQNGNGYHQNGNGYHQNGNGRYAPVNNGPKKTPVAAPVNKFPKETPVAAPINNSPKETPVAAPVNNGPKQTPVAAPINNVPKQKPVAAPNGPKQTPVAEK